MGVRACVLLVALTSAAHADAPEKVRKPPPAVVDEAGLFNAETKQRAQQIADEIREEFGIDVCVETVTEVPGLEYTARLARQREELHKQAQEWADDRGVEGLYVLVLKDESRLLVGVVPWPAWRTQHAYTSRYKRYRLQKFLEHGLRTSPNDTLVKALEQLRHQLVQSKELGESPLPALTALALLGGLVGFWLVIRVGRARASERKGPLYQPAVQGSLFGVPAGFWVYDRLFQAERNRLQASGALTPSTPAHEPPEQHDDLAPPADPTSGAPV